MVLLSPSALHPSPHYHCHRHHHHCHHHCHHHHDAGDVPLLFPLCVWTEDAAFPLVEEVRPIFNNVVISVLIVVIIIVIIIIVVSQATF